MRHIHGLDSGELNASLLPKQHSRLHSKVTVVVEPETERPPLKVVQRCDGSTQQKGDDGEDNDGERDGWHPREADDVVQAPSQRVNALNADGEGDTGECGKDRYRVDER